MPLRFILLLSLVLALPAKARLVEIPLEQFQERARCGVIGAVAGVRTADTGKAGLSSLNRIARFRVSTVFGGEACQNLPRELELHFSTEIHSSHPKEGERAVLFPKLEDDRYVEAVYGRSYWPLQKHEERDFVVVSWRNDFLVAPIELESGEMALIPLSAAVRLWVDPHAGSAGEGDAPSGGAFSGQRPRGEARGS